MPPLVPLIPPTPPLAPTPDQGSEQAEPAMESCDEHGESKMDPLVPLAFRRLLGLAATKGVEKSRNSVPK